ncbi:hypothetical protein HBH92_187170 [Parastagonospora nodorum]|nr:hypothetical protein HBH50_186140 [Parastagonospora nodorum]KAH4086519.1 hypothetical protein HBH46_203850 [Parastagonospora nodorum]KAH4404719.1 hypothetical protein HBH92_187170 [Parastagonospora nodorum]KAH4465298.1 hypothetical protein HBH91_035910 [Parastagonospora nodorum]KAH4530348.1 hypothetical protein HBH85_191500 [Parastagonospora nodorum]
MYAKTPIRDTPRFLQLLESLFHSLTYFRGQFFKFSGGNTGRTISLQRQRVDELGEVETRKSFLLDLGDCGEERCRWLDSSCEDVIRNAGLSRRLTRPSRPCSKAHVEVVWAKGSGVNL